MSVLETIYTRRPWSGSRKNRILFHAGLSLFNTVISRLVSLIPIFILLDFVDNSRVGLRHYFGLYGIYGLLSTVIVFDLFNYWWHRVNHTIGFFWRFHRYHHMDTELDSTTALRFHPMELILSYGIKSVWIIIWGPSITDFLIFESLITGYAVFHHSNIDLGDRWESLVRLIHITPRLHTAHHTVSRRTRDSNYSTIFSFWDRLFRTLKDATQKEMSELGIDEGRQNYLKLTTIPLSIFRRIP